jgi:hypothetical protein
MQCQEFREIADSYLGNELIVETNHAIISHLEYCAECRRELTARRELRARLRQAFLNASENQMRPEFTERLNTQLHARALGKRDTRAATFGTSRSSIRLGRKASLALAACLLLAMAIGFVAVRQRDSSVTSRESIETELAQSAVSDHRDCAVHFRLAEKPIDLEAAGRKYDPVYINLTKAVLMDQGGAMADAEFVEAHSCVLGGRRFAHIVFNYHGRLVSFLVTDSGDPNGTNGGGSSAIAQPQVNACSQFDGYQVSCFQTVRHAVFVVSDLSESENLALARALAPSVYAHITRTERAA